MKILSIMWGSACSTAAVMVDGEIIGCVSEERFSRIKNDEAYPKQAIESVLTTTGIRPSELNAVVFGGQTYGLEYILVRRWSSFSVQDRMKEQTSYWYPRMYEGSDNSFIDVFPDKIDTQQYGEWDELISFLRKGNPAKEREFYQEYCRKLVKKHIGTPSENIYFTDHHTAHGYYAYYGSPIRNTNVLILTADAWGDDMNATVSLASGSNIVQLSSSSQFQAARLYRSMTLLLGMKPDEHEFKVMGLAAYAKPEYYQEAYQVFKETQYVDGLGFAYALEPRDLYVHFREKLEGVRFDAIAGALQQYTEDILVNWARNAIDETGATGLVFGGGAAMNVKANMQMSKIPAIGNIFVCPSPSDESLAMGAAYSFMNQALHRKGEAPHKVKEAIDSFAGRPEYTVHINPSPAYVASLLADGKIVARCVGASEFGARALGNRSILADPRNISVVRRLNDKVKSRDFWMPFAATILSTRATDYLKDHNGIAAPYMTMAFDTTELAHKDIVAGLHQGDLTSRPQILEYHHNPDYHSLIAEFERITGVGALLNTSLNLHGEPIVQTPSDAQRVFEQADLDILQLDGFLVEKT